MKRLKELLFESFKSHDRDFTQGLISDAVILLAIPMILELSLESVFAIVDMFFVSKLGPNAIAAVGLTESVATLVYSLGIGFSAGATAVVARRTGEKDQKGASVAAAQAILIGLVGSLVISVVGAYFAPDLLQLMGASPEVVAVGAVFPRILIGGSSAIILLFLINGIFRGAGNATIAMRSLWIASGTNILLCPILIHFMGLAGAATATFIGRTTGVLYQCYSLSKTDHFLRIKKEYFKPKFEIIKSLFDVSMPASIQFVIGSGSWILLNRFVAEVGGTSASAGYQISFRNFVFFILPAWGLSNAAATLVGQNLGAHQYNRAVESVRLTAKYSMVAMGMVTLFIMIFATHMVNAFTDDPAVLEQGALVLRIFGSGFIFYGLAMIYGQSLNGAGDTKTPTRLNFLCFWIFQTPLAYVLAFHTRIGVFGSALSIPIAHVLLTYLTRKAFQSERWKTIQV